MNEPTHHVYAQQYPQPPWSAAVQQQDRRRRAANARNQAAGQILTGLALIALGAALTALTFAMAEPGGTFVVAFGPIIFGAISVLAGLGNAVRSLIR